MSIVAQEVEAPRVADSRRRLRVLGKRFLRRPMAVAGLLVVLGFVVVAIFAPLLAPFSAGHVDFNAILAHPSSKHLLGTDDLGHDVLSRVELPRSNRVDLARARYMVALAHREDGGVRAPVWGRLLAMKVAPHETFEPGQPLFTILADDELWCAARFEEPEFAVLRVGQQAVISVEGRALPGRISELGGPDAPARIEFVLRPVSELRPGMPATVVVTPQ